jgi:hypothetical protein
MRSIWRGVAARFQVTDEEHVERVRRTLAAHGRRRRLLVALYAVSAVAFIGLLVATALLLQGLMQWGNMQGLAPGFLVGLGLGAMVGGLALTIGHGLVTALAPLRTERLLLHYHDALAGIAEAPAATALQPE